ncbi:hypothetical protein ACVIGB_002075 [Bradyrhizobium sp. USDA 4341]
MPGRSKGGICAWSIPRQPIDDQRRRRIGVPIERRRNNALPGRLSESVHTQANWHAVTVAFVSEFSGSGCSERLRRSARVRFDRHPKGRAPGHCRMTIAIRWSTTPPGSQRRSLIRKTRSPNTCSVKESSRLRRAGTSEPCSAAAGFRYPSATSRRRKRWNSPRKNQPTENCPFRSLHFSSDFVAAA